MNLKKAFDPTDLILFSRLNSSIWPDFDVGTHILRFTWHSKHLKIIIFIIPNVKTTVFMANILVTDTDRFRNSKEN